MTYERRRRDLEIFEIRPLFKFDDGGLVPIPPGDPDHLALFEPVYRLGESLEDLGSAAVTLLERHERCGGKIECDGLVRTSAVPTRDQGSAEAGLEGDRGRGRVVLVEERVRGRHGGVSAASAQRGISCTTAPTAFCKDEGRLTRGGPAVTCALVSSMLDTSTETDATHFSRRGPPSQFVLGTRVVFRPVAESLCERSL